MKDLHNKFNFDQIKQELSAGFQCPKCEYTFTPIHQTEADTYYHFPNGCDYAFHYNIWHDDDLVKFYSAQEIDRLVISKAGCKYGNTTFSNIESMKDIFDKLDMFEFYK